MSPEKENAELLQGTQDRLILKALRLIDLPGYVKPSRLFLVHP